MRRSDKTLREFVGARCAVLAIVLLSWTASLAAADGDLDPVFGVDGKVTINWSLGDAIPHTVAVDSSARIVVAGEAQPYGGVTNVLLLRLSTVGDLDTSFAFADGGFFQYDFDLNGIGSGGGNTAKDVLVQPDGNIVAAGCANFDVTSSHFAVLRVDTAGNLDTNFGSGGAAHFGAPFAVINCANALRLDANNRLVIAGYAAHSLAVGSMNEFQYYAAATRLTPTGALDPNFSQGNIDEFLLSPGAQYNFAYATGIDGTGRILIAGETDTPGPPTGAALRMLADGQVDPGFGSSGRVPLPIAGSIVSALYQLPSGAAMLGGVGVDAQNNQIVFLAKLGADGSPDSSFGTSGIASFQLGTAGLVGLIAPTKRNGWLLEALDNRYGVFLVRTDAAGNPDAAFGTNGVVHIMFDPVFNSLFDAGKPAMQADGKLVVAGFMPEAAANGNYDFGVMRILADYDTIFVGGFEPTP